MAHQTKEESRMKKVYVLPEIETILLDKILLDATDPVATSDGTDTSNKGYMPVEGDTGFNH